MNWFMIFTTDRGSTVGAVEQVKTPICVPTEDAWEQAKKVISF